MATNKQFPQIRARIFKSAVAATLALATAVATTMPGARLSASDWMPMLPDQDFYDFQLFAPPDLGSYNMYRRDDDGIYFNYDRIYWGITVPRTVVTGTTEDGQLNIIPSNPISPYTFVNLNNDYLAFAQDNPITISTTTAGGTTLDTTEIPNTSQNITMFEIGSDPLRLDLNTSWMRTKMTWGNRYEGGWSYGGRGVHLSYFQLGKQSQSFGTMNEFAVNSPTTITTFTQSGEGQDAGGNALDNNNADNDGAAVRTITLNTEVDSPPPDHLITQSLLQRNNTEIQSASVALTLKKQLGRRAGSTQLTYSLGPRFVQVADRYEMDYVSFQNSFNILGGNGTANNNTAVNTGGGGVGGNTNTEGTTAGPTGGTTGGTAGGTTGGTTSQTTGPGGDVSETLTTGLGGAGLAGITIGDLPSTLTGTGPGSVFQVADWETYTSNNMVGPEFGVMFEGSQGAWDWYAGGTFTAAFNWQNNIYKGANLPASTGADYLRSNFTGGGLSSVAYTASGGGGDNAAQASVSVVQVPPSPLVTQIFGVGQTGTTNSARHEFTFAPIGEWRFGARYRVSKSISLNFGYTGMWMSQIARASTNTKFQAVVKATAQATRNRTATLDQNGEFIGGQTAVVDANMNFRGYEANGLTTELPSGWQRVPPTTVIGDTEIRNPQEFVELTPAAYIQQSPNSGANDYVLTNGIDFGLEIKY